MQEDNRGLSHDSTGSWFFFVATRTPEDYNPTHSHVLWLIKNLRFSGLAVKIKQPWSLGLCCCSNGKSRKFEPFHWLSSKRTSTNARTSMVRFVAFWWGLGKGKVLPELITGKRTFLPTEKEPSGFSISILSWSLRTPASSLNVINAKHEMSCRCEKSATPLPIEIFASFFCKNVKQFECQTQIISCH